jgi:predicted Rossmann fold nucleotide-binding protein DprA/Smf involved in DNA uptake
MIHLGIVGSRAYRNTQRIRDYIDTLPQDYVIVSGGAKGVDTIAETYAKSKGMQTIILKADWDKHGKSAGFIRNGAIVGASNVIVAFWDGKSKGTLDTIVKANLAGKVVKIYPDWVV